MCFVFLSVLKAENLSSLAKFCDAWYDGCLVVAYVQHMLFILQLCSVLF